MTGLPLNPGEPYNPRRLPEYVSSVQSYFAKSGYPLAKVTAKLSNEGDPQDSILAFAVAKGPAKIVGRVVVRGNVKTLDGVVQRKIALQAGDPYDAEALFRTQQSIYQLGFFDRVSVEPIHPISDDPDEPVDLVVALHERETGWLGFGGGYGLQQGPQVSAEYLQNNVGGTGRPLRVEGVYSAPRRSFQASLRDPHLFNSNYIGELGGSYQRERRQLDQPLVETYGPTIGVSRQLTDAMFSSLRYAWSQSTYLPGEYTAADLAANGGTPLRVNSVLTGGLTYDTRSDLLNPRWGTKADLMLDFATPLLAGSLTYTRPRLVIAHHIPLPRRIVFAVGGELGYIRPLAGPYLLPYDLLFLAGGANSLRGYEFNKVGQPSPDGTKIIGGELMAITHAEARIPVWGDVGVVGFVDAGNVWPRLQDVSLTSFKVSSGLGLRYNTPVGPVRVDYAVRVAPTFEFAGLEGLYLGLGHAF
jgi:outer membrane protein assembly complex protein YaeT